jgi:cell division protein FtsA
MRQSAPGFPTENSVFLMAPVQFLTVETKDENKVSSNPLYAAVDLGSTKVVAVAGHAVDDNLFEVVGLGTSPTGSALRNGTIIGVPQAVTAINRAVDQAQRMAGRPIKHVVVGFAGGEIVGMDQRVTIALRDREVQPSDIEKVLQEARSMINRPQAEILHVIPKSYTIDDLANIPNPVGMVGARLEAHVHVIRGSEMVIANLRRTIERSGLLLQEGDLVLQPLAAARALLTEDDKELGVAIVDIGGGTTNLAVYVNGSLAAIRMFPYGGINMTKDLAIVLQVSQEEAERIKIDTLGRVLQKDSPEPVSEISENSAKPDTSEQETQVMDVVEARLGEILGIVARELREMRLESRLQRGVVLTGGVVGMPRMIPFAQKVLSPLHVTIGTVRPRIQGLVERAIHPEFASAIGLLYYARDHWGDAYGEESPGLAEERTPEKPKDKKVLSGSSRLLNWFREII